MADTTSKYVTGVNQNPNTTTKKASTKTTKKTTSTPSEDVAGDPPTNATTGSKTSLSGVPLNTPIKSGTDTSYQTGAGVTFTPTFTKAQYTTDSPYLVVATKSNQDKANLLLALAAVPGLYKSGTAPTIGFVKSQGNAISFRPEDYSALTKVMIHADTVGQDYNTSLITFVNNPGIAQQYFGTSGGKLVSVSAKADLLAEFNSKTMDLFDTKVDPKLAASYAKEVNTAEYRAGGGIGSDLKTEIFNKYVQQFAMQRFKAAAATPDEADNIALETGSLGSVIKKIRAAHADNGIPASEKEIYSKALKSIRSQQALDNEINKLSTQAITQFPAFKEQILAGTSVKDLLAPYLEKYQTIYGKTPKIADLYEVGAGQTAMPVAEWEKKQWADDKIKNTKYYKDTVKSDLRSMAEAFGVRV